MKNLWNRYKKYVIANMKHNFPCWLICISFTLDCIVMFQSIVHLILEHLDAGVVGLRILIILFALYSAITDGVLIIHTIDDNQKQGYRWWE